MQNSFRIIGSSLTALVIVNHLRTKENSRVEWVLTNKSRIGGHFYGANLFNSNLDLGMVALEVDEPVKQIGMTNLQNPPTGSEINPFLNLVKRWLFDNGSTLREITVETRYNQKRYPDILIANNLSLLTEREFKNKIIDSIIIGNQAKLNHPRLKGTNSFKKYMSIEKYFTLMYPNSPFKEVIFRFIEKIDTKLLSKVIISKHRSIWIPLYYPETVEEAQINSKLNQEILRSFMCIEENTFANFIHSLEFSIRTSSNTSIVENLKINSKFDLESMINDSANQNWINIFADDQKLLIKTDYYNFENIGISLIYIKTYTELEDVIVFDTDLDNSFYRVTSRSSSRALGFNYICIECSKELIEFADTDEYKVHLKKYIDKLFNIDLRIEEICLKSGKLPILNEDYVKFIEKETKGISTFLKENNIVDLSHNGLNNSMNEQILSALWYIEQIETHFTGR